MRPTLKRAIRRISRKFGYELVPARAGMACRQTMALSTVDLLLDVGANVGQYAEKMRSLGYQGQIISFEPQSQAFDQLGRVARRDAAWQTRRMALGATSAQQVELFQSENSVSSSLLAVRDEHVTAAPKARIVGKELVQLSTLDDQLEDIDRERAIWLKLDVQGHELAVLLGAKATLACCQVVQVELSFAPLYENQSSWLRVCQLLTDAGLALTYLEPGFEDPTTGTMQQADALFTRG